MGWDTSHPNCHLYLLEAYNKNASENVYNECGTVFDRTRRIQTEFLDYLYNNLQNINVISNFHGQLNYWKGQYFDLEKHESYGIPKDRFKKLINSFSNECFDDIHSSMFSYDSYQSFLLEIRKAFNNVTDELDVICYNANPKVVIHEDIPVSYEFTFPEIVDELTSVGIHKSDRNILLDSYYIKKYIILTDMVFLTEDRKIIREQSTIESALSGINIRRLT